MLNETEKREMEQLTETTEDQIIESEKTVKKDEVEIVETSSETTPSRPKWKICVTFLLLLLIIGAGSLMLKPQSLVLVDLIDIP